MIVSHSLVTPGFSSDWLLPVDVGELLLSEPRKYAGVSLCNSVHWCCEYICSTSGTQHSIRSIRYAFTLLSKYEKKEKVHCICYAFQLLH